MTSITRHQIRAARALLAPQQEALCQEADVVEALLKELERQGAVLIPPGTVVDGREVCGGCSGCKLKRLRDQTRSSRHLLPAAT